LSASAGRRPSWPWLAPPLSLGLICSLWFLPFTLDDPYVSFRYAAHLASGSGLVYNPGEHVEGYTNFLWTVLLGAVIRVGGDPLLSSKLLGMALHVVTIATLWWCVRELVARRVSPGRAAEMSATVAAATYAVSWYPAMWSIGSLETPLFTALLVLGFAAVLLDRPATASLLLLLAALTRPEGVLYFAVLVALLVYRHLCAHRRLPGPARLVRWVAPFAIPFAAFIAWRLAYYGVPLPNTYYDKSGGSLRFALANGVSSLASFLGTSLGQAPRRWPAEAMLPVGAVLGAAAVLAVTAVLLVRRAVRRGQAELGLAAAWVMLDFGCTLLEGGDWMPGFRFAIPACPFLALLAGAGLGRLTSTTAARRRGLRAAMIAGAAAAVVAMSWMQLRAVDAQVPWLRPLAQVRAVQPEPSYLAAATWLRGHAGAGSLVAIEEAGLIPYYADGLRYLDLFGLTDAHLARAPGQPPFAKEDNAYVLGRRPEYVLLWVNTDAGGTEFAPHASLLGNPEFSGRYRLLLTLPRGTRDRSGNTSRFLLFAREDVSPVSRRPGAR
jgi:arabinofuranosyltransferase